MVSKASEDFPLPLGPVTTLNFPSARSKSTPFRLFWRAPRISMQPRSAGAITEFFPSTFEPTGNYFRMRAASQISEVGFLCKAPHRHSDGDSKATTRDANRNFRNIDLWPVRPADILSAAVIDWIQRSKTPLGAQTWRSMFQNALRDFRAAFPILSVQRHPTTRRISRDP